METNQQNTNTRASKVDSIRKYRTIARACSKALKHYDSLEAQGLYVPPAIRSIVASEQEIAVAGLNACLLALRV